MRPGKKSGTVFDQLRQGPLQVAIIGAGNWGTAISKACAANAATSYLFNTEVWLWALEEEVAEAVNTVHENTLYLPGIKLPENVRCSTDLKEITAKADLLVMVVPHQFLAKTCNMMKGHARESAQAISLTKGLHVEEDCTPVAYTTIIEDTLGINCCALSGANVARDVALEQFSEATIGFEKECAEVVPIWQQLFDRPDFRIRCIPDKFGVEVNGAIKNIVAIAAGFCDGLGLGTNTKSAIIRIGAEELRLFLHVFFPSASTQVFYESCGFADLITTCFGGRNVKCAGEFARRGGSEKGVTWEQLEKEMLGGQFLQGTLCAKEVRDVLVKHDIFDFFPLFKITYEIAYEKVDVRQIIEVFRDTKPQERSIMSVDDLKNSVPVYVPPGLADRLALLNGPVSSPALGRRF